MQGSYNEWLVAISLAVAVLASYTALDMAGRVSATRGRAAGWWLAGGALAMGFGVWSMHFIGMLAFSLPVPLGYDLGLTLYSMVVSVLASAFALWLVSRRELPYPRLAAGALLMGLGIAAMHYLGMAAMRMQPGIDYHPGWFALSLAIAIAASAAALWIAFRLRSGHRRYVVQPLAALVMGLAIVGMHYTGMAAARFPPESICGAARDGGMPVQWLAVLVVVVTLGVTAMALGVSVLDRHFQQRTELLASSLAAANRELEQAALHDSLTRLPNRLLLQDRIQQGLERAQRRRRRFAVMFLDLDGFKAINDAYGHQAGDALLVAVASRLGTLLRSDDTLARLGGDEFVLALPVDEPEDAAALAERVVAALVAPFKSNDIELRVSTSIGIAIYPEDGTHDHVLIANADAAMYHAKATGRNGYAFFEPSMNRSAHEKMLLVRDLPLALERRQFVLHYQPKYGAHGRDVVGAEALMRWQHPERGLIMPDRFIPVAERIGLIVPIGEWALEEACRQMREWREAGRGDWNVAVNLSPVQLASPGLVACVGQALARHGIDPARLTLEITESAAMRDADASLEVLKALHELGVNIAIDDFGTGYSNLMYLKRLPACELKIDRMFVQGLQQEGEDRAIVAAIVGLARTLNMKVVAEGVETELQRHHLRDLGCDQLQGYLMSRPLEPRSFIAAASL
ncbi:putative bifunctional diguanylate cyclase/phosphodiesterase [[Pseudomonas] boreopolis]|uniref:cyclic-guanylate-specific phosphodiesterase n=1 Tax=Xanthomonas boreopolis TaxID=86183 RepID=A0A919KGG7_9XANT|nr:bifunctional diguanylate cyclase/phosphodiesterase [[Pseudomonas] boreopolis]